MPTFMENIADRRIVQDDHLAQVRLNGAQILDVAPIPERAMLSVVPAGKVFLLLLEPVDDWISILLDRGGESNDFVPFAYFAEKLVTVRTLVDVIKDGMVGADYTWRRGGLTWDSLGHGAIDRSIELDFDHVAG